MRLRFMTMTLACMLAPLGCAHALDVRQQIELGYLYTQASLKTGTFACAQRFPDLGTRLTELQAAWKTRHAAALAEMAQLEAQLVTALEAAPQSDAPKWVELSALHTQGTMWALYSLATVNDDKARELCGRMAAGFTDDASLQTNFDSARTAAKAALAEFQAAPR